MTIPMQWYKIRFKKEQISNAFSSYVSDKLHQKILQSAAQRDVYIQLAAFVSPADDFEADGSMTYYLSPMLALISPDVISEAGAIPCSPPKITSPDSLGVLESFDNKEAAWTILRSF